MEGEVVTRLFVVFTGVVDQFWSAGRLPGLNSSGLREAIKKKLIFSDFVRKREGGSRTKPTFLHKDNLGSNFKGRGAKLLFPKSKFHLVLVLGVISKFYSDLSLKNKENFCFSCRIFGDLLLQRTNLQ